MPEFILATTEVDKLPATIISRCQRFDLRRIPTGLIVNALERIAASEQVEAENDALLAIARGAEGGMRDALSALDQIISFKGSPVTEADVLAIFGLVSRGQLEKLATAILKGDMAEGLRIIDELDRGGKDLRRLVLELLNHFRNLLVYQQLGGDTTALDVTPGQLEVLEQQAGLADAARVLRVAEHLAELEGRIRQALSRRTLLETTLVRAAVPPPPPLISHPATGGVQATGVATGADSPSSPAAAYRARRLHRHNGIRTSGCTVALAAGTRAGTSGPGFTLRWPKPRHDPRHRPHSLPHRRRRRNDR